MNWLQRTWAVLTGRRSSADTLGDHGGPQLEPELDVVFDADRLAAWFVGNYEDVCLSSYSDGYHRFWTFRSSVGFVYYNKPVALPETLHVFIYHHQYGRATQYYRKSASSTRDAFNTLRLAISLVEAQALGHAILDAGFILD